MYYNHDIKLASTAKLSSDCKNIKFKNNDYVIYVGKEQNIYGNCYIVKYVFDELDVVKYKIQDNNGFDFLVDEHDIMNIDEYESIKNIIHRTTNDDICSVKYEAKSEIDNTINHVQYTDYRVNELEKNIKNVKKIAKLAFLSKFI